MSKDSYDVLKLYNKKVYELSERLTCNLNGCVFLTAQQILFSMTTICFIFRWGGGDSVFPSANRASAASLSFFFEGKLFFDRCNGLFRPVVGVEINVYAPI